MLSGLSHDPLQRDMFTALMVGGAICIPDPEEMASPGWLAEWMRQERVTVTHLTPAMGQVLTNIDEAGIKTAVAKMPDLRFAFFVGDKLAWIDVDRLRRLAPNVTCVNFYGSTETQRAVGHYTVDPAAQKEADDQERPAGKEVLPLGQGIADVQLLVLNAAGGLCGVAETGEVHVRSPHLARGYLNNDALTAEQFIVNPLTRQPEDRLYKTGDLGRYREDGNVEFLGRNDHQIKVRGFRIEPGEIESALVRHPGLGQAVVLALAEDQQGNHRLVCYFTSSSVQVPTVSDLRRFLKTDLPDYMIPVIFVMLDELPLTPNGKIDRRALPDPGEAGLKLTDQYIAPRNELERTIAEVWAKVLSVERVGIHDNFFELGGHSLAATRLIAQLQQALEIELPLRSLFEESTVAGLARHIERDERGRGSRFIKNVSGWESLVPMQPSGSRPPLFLVSGAHAEEEEFLRYLSNLIPHLGLDQPVYGFQARGLDGKEEAHTTVESMARDYISELRDFQPQGPYLISGECVGGVVAYEMAQQLRQQGETVALLALMDTTRPTRAQQYYGYYRLLKFKVKNAKNHLRSARRLGLRGGLKYIADFGRRKRKLLIPMGENERRVSRIRHVEETYPRIMRRYRPKPFPGKLTLIINQEYYTRWLNLGWQDLAQGQLEIHVVPGNHVTRLTMHGKATADNLRNILEQAQQEHWPELNS